MAILWFKTVFMWRLHKFVCFIVFAFKSKAQQKICFILFFDLYLFDFLWAVYITKIHYFIFSHFFELHFSAVSVVWFLQIENDEYFLYLVVDSILFDELNRFHIWYSFYIIIIYFLILFFVRLTQFPIRLEMNEPFWCVNIITITIGDVKKYPINRILSTW